LVVFSFLGFTLKGVAMDRRVFLQNTAGTLGGLAAVDALSPLLGASQAARPDLAVVKGASADKIVRTAIDTIGGIRRFISKDDIVVIKPNIGWDRKPEQAANTNPEVVATLVKLCLEAGAKTVKVFDRTCHDQRRCYENSGIEAAAKAAGAEVVFVGGRTLSAIEERKYRDVKIPNGVAIKSWALHEDVLDPKVKLINVPIAKDHGSTKLSMSLKNWMGVMGDNRGQAHQKLDTAIVDISTVIKPTLVVIDAIRVLTANGPTGGNLNDVKRLDTVVAGVDPVATDAYGTTFFGMEAKDIGHIREAAERGLGKMDLSKLNISKIEV
jgi:uncharacterized protein (DUF362 family)